MRTAINLPVFFARRRRHTSSLCDWISDVCSSDLTLSSTNATPAGRSVTDSRRFTLITGRQLLSVLIRRQWPSPARSLACIRDRNRDCQPESCGTDRTFQRVFQSAWTRIQPALSVLSRHPKPESAGLLSRHPQRLLDRSPWFSGSQGPGCLKPYRGSVRFRDAPRHPAKAFRVLHVRPDRMSTRLPFAAATCTDCRQRSRLW